MIAPRLFGRLVVAALLFCFATVAVAAGKSRAEEQNVKRFALVIGNAAYTHVPPLDNPLNDERDVCKTLKSLGFNAICLENARKKRDMKEAVAKFRDNLKNGGMGLFYYSGHGMQIKGENYLIPTDAEIHSEADAEDEALSLNYVLGNLDDAGNKFNVVILDACRDNPFGRGFRSARRGLAQVDAPSGTLVAFSTSPGASAADGTGRNGTYTKHLLSNMQEPGVTIEEMFKRVRIGVVDDTAEGDKQTPWESSSLTGTFCFAGCRDNRIDQEMERLKAEKAALEKEKQNLQANKPQMDQEWARLKQEKEALEKERQRVADELARRVEEQKHLSSAKRTAASAKELEEQRAQQEAMKKMQEQMARLEKEMTRVQNERLQAENRLKEEQARNKTARPAQEAALMAPAF